MDLGLAGRTVLVTGATRGIGLAIVERLAAEGADVGLCARDAGAVQRVADQVRAVGRRAHGVALDVTAPGAAAAFVEECRAALGRVDAVVASAGGAVGPPTFAATSDDDWEATYRWNVVHPAALVRAARPALAVEGGAAVLVGSISAARPSPWPQYAAAKAAQESVTRSLAAELAPDRIRVNCVRPGSIRFPGGAWERYAEAEPGAYADFVARDLPWGALGRPEHVADVVAFVALAAGVLDQRRGHPRRRRPAALVPLPQHRPARRHGGAPVIKVIGTAYRRADFSMDDFIAYWNDVHAPISARVPGMRGYVVSEVVRRMLGDLEADAFVEQWWDDEAAFEATRETPELAAAWADVANYARMDGTFWITREHVLKTPSYDDQGLLQGGSGQRAGRLKAIGTAYKRDDFTTAAFFDYWRDVHAPISARAPGLGAYVVSEVLERLQGTLDADAFVEQWWEDEATLLAAGDSPEVAVAWEDVANYAKTTGTFWIVKEHVQIVPPYDGPGLLER